MDSEIEEVEGLMYLKEKRQRLEERIENSFIAQDELANSLGRLIPNLVSTLDISIKVISAFNGARDQCKRVRPCKRHPVQEIEQGRNLFKRGSNLCKVSQARALSIVKVMVVHVLLDRLPFLAIDSVAILRKLENDHCNPLEKNALFELGGELGGIAAIELVLRTLADESAGVEIEEYKVSGKSRIMVLEIDRSQLGKFLPETQQQQNSEGTGVVPSQGTAGGMNGAPFGMMGPDPGGISGLEMGFSGFPPTHRSLLGTTYSSGLSSSFSKPRIEEDDMKELEALLNKKSFRETQNSKTGEELLDLINRPTARESAAASKVSISIIPWSDVKEAAYIKGLVCISSNYMVQSLMPLLLVQCVCLFALSFGFRESLTSLSGVLQFKTKGGLQLNEYCSALTKDDCRRRGGFSFACEKVHFRRIIAQHTDVNLGDCSYLDACRHMKTCKYVHYELDLTPDAPAMMMLGTPGRPLAKPLKRQRVEYCSEVELGEAQWINCDIRTFRVDILGQFGVIMADPPWDIHMELPYGTMADDEMRNLKLSSLQTDGLIFLWVTGRAMELGRECLELWGYCRVEELIWVKTNQLQRIIRTGRTGHWLNHSKEHCLVGIKGNPEVNRNIDTDVIVSEVRETSRKPDEMYALLERISPRTRKLELFARIHNTHAGWISLGNQLNGVRLVDEGLRARFKAAYPDVEVDPPSPPRETVQNLEVESPKSMDYAQAGYRTGSRSDSLVTCWLKTRKHKGAKPSLSVEQAVEANSWVAQGFDGDERKQGQEESSGLQEEWKRPKAIEQTNTQLSKQSKSNNWLFLSIQNLELLKRPEAMDYVQPGYKTGSKLHPFATCWLKTGSVNEPNYLPLTVGKRSDCVVHLLNCKFTWKVASVRALVMIICNEIFVLHADAIQISKDDCFRQEMCFAKAQIGFHGNYVIYIPWYSFPKLLLIWINASEDTLPLAVVLDVMLSCIASPSPFHCPSSGLNAGLLLE
eukprot:Gb_00270 [translate_table: standard]